MSNNDASTKTSSANAAKNYSTKYGCVDFPAMYSLAEIQRVMVIKPTIAKPPNMIERGLNFIRTSYAARITYGAAPPRFMVQTDLKIGHNTANPYVIVEIVTSPLHLGAINARDYVSYRITYESVGHIVNIPHAEFLTFMARRYV
jgi:hypothetical protein